MDASGVRSSCETIPCRASFRRSACSPQAGLIHGPADIDPLKRERSLFDDLLDPLHVLFDQSVGVVPDIDGNDAMVDGLEDTALRSQNVCERPSKSLRRSAESLVEVIITMASRLMSPGMAVPSRERTSISSDEATNAAHCPRAVGPQPAQNIREHQILLRRMAQRQLPGKLLADQSLAARSAATNWPRAGRSRPARLVMDATNRNGNGVHRLVGIVDSQAVIGDVEKEIGCGSSAKSRRRRPAQNPHRVAKR